MGAHRADEEENIHYHEKDKEPFKENGEELGESGAPQPLLMRREVKEEGFKGWTFHVRLLVVG